MAEPAIAEHRPADGFVSELEARNLHPLWDRYQRITPIKPQAQDAPFLWRWSEVEPFLHRSVAEVSINDIERRALILAHPAFAKDTTTTSTLLAAFTVLDPGDRARPHRHTGAAIRFATRAEGAVSGASARWRAGLRISGSDARAKHRTDCPLPDERRPANALDRSTSQIDSR